MQDEETVTQDRFRSSVAAHWAAVMAGDTKAADRETTVLDELVNQWQDRLADLLSPLLAHDESPRVRCAAATYLLNRGHAAQALPVLTALADDDEIGLVAEDAELALLVRRRQQKDAE